MTIDPDKVIDLVRLIIEIAIGFGVIKVRSSQVDTKRQFFKNNVLRDRGPKGKRGYGED